MFLHARHNLDQSKNVSKDVAKLARVWTFDVTTTFRHPKSGDMDYDRNSDVTGIRRNQKGSMFESSLQHDLKAKKILILKSGREVRQ